MISKLFRRAAGRPSMSYKRQLRYFKLRLARMPHSTENIAAALAIGAAISFTPLPGTHMWLALLLCFLFRLNALAGILGSFVGNPWTLGPMWFMAWEIGRKTMALFGFHTKTPLPDSLSLGMIWERLGDNPMGFMGIWIVGGCLCALLSWPFFYFGFYLLIDKVRLSIPRRLRKKATLA